MLPAPQGSHYSIAAGERSEPAESGPHHHRPQGGRTLVVCGCPALSSPRVAALHRLLPWLAVQSVCPFDPLGAVHIYVWLSFRGFAALTRGYRVVWPPWGRRPRRHSAAKSRERRRPAACRCGTAVLVPMSVQRICDAVVPVAIPAACRGGTAVPIPHLYRHPAKLPAPQGSHYSITAGERSEPVEGGLPPPSAPRGSNALCGCPAPASFGWQLSTGLLPWLAVQSVCPFDPLGAVHIYVWLSVRGFAMLTRGYRVVRPPWGRLPRRHSAAKSRERRRPRRHPRCMPWWYRRPHTTSV